MPWPRVLALSALVAVGAALFAQAFRAALMATIETITGQPDILSGLEALPLWARLGLPAAGALLAGLAAQQARALKSQGDVMEAIALGRGRPGMRATLWRAAGSFLAMGGGGSVGREGPLIQFGGALGAAISDRFGLGPREARAVLSAGVAAGFAAAYNTPLAAVLFVLEVLVGAMVLDVVVPSILGATIATTLLRALAHPGPIYGVRSFALESPLELVVHALLGVLAGVVGACFIALLAIAEERFAKAIPARPWRAASGGLAVGMLLCALPLVGGNGYETIGRLLSSELPTLILVLLLLLKPIATALSVGSGSPGGVFTPSLLTGAALGALVGRAADAILPDGAAGADGGYALVGMAALVAATTHAPLMAAVLVFEVTRDYAIALPLALATALASIVARRLRPASIYLEELRRRGIDWDAQRARLAWLDTVREAQETGGKAPSRPPPAPDDESGAD